MLTTEHDYSRNAHRPISLPCAVPTPLAQRCHLLKSSRLRFCPSPDFRLRFKSPPVPGHHLQAPAAVSYCTGRLFDELERLDSTAASRFGTW